MATIAFTVGSCPKLARMVPYTVIQLLLWSADDHVERQQRHVIDIPVP